MNASVEYVRVRALRQHIHNSLVLSSIDDNWRNRINPYGM